MLYLTVEDNRQESVVPSCHGNCRGRTTERGRPRASIHAAEDEVGEEGRQPLPFRHEASRTIFTRLRGISLR